MNRLRWVCSLSLTPVFAVWGHAAPVIQNIRTTDKTAATVTIACETSAPAAVFVHYGETTDYGYVEHGNHDYQTRHVRVLEEGLKRGTLYHFRLEAWDDESSVFSADQTFTTLGGARPGDINGDGFVTLTDLSLFLARWHTPDAAADIDGSGDVDLTDLSRLLSQWDA